jgi:hypothetical protein
MNVITGVDKLKVRIKVAANEKDDEDDEDN